MKGYLALLTIRMKTLFQYRSAALSGICAQLFWCVVQVMIFQAFYDNSSLALEAMSLKKTITFIWLGQGLLQLLPWTIDKEIELHVKNGNVVYELVRPLHLYGLWFCRSFALRLIPALMRSPPLFIIGGLFFDLSGPASWEGGVAFSLSVVCSLFLSTAITTLMAISLFWTLSGEGIQRLLPHLAVFLSGLTIPLPLFPSWIQPFMLIQPFRGIFDIPCRLYTGIISPSETLYYLSFQITWTVILIALGQVLMSRAQLRFVIQGG